MPEREDLIAAVRQLVELDRGFGVAFAPRAPAEIPAAAAPPPRAPAPAPAPRSPPPPPSPLPPPAAPPAQRQHRTPTGLASADLGAIGEEIRACTACGLCKGRRQAVPGEGNPAPELLFIGEGPGAEEDAQGRPFVGPAGQLLDRMIGAMGFRRDEVFIANVVKCRPPGNRTPEPPEVAACMPFLERQVLALRPRVICALGNTPLRALSGDPLAGITRQRGKAFAWHGIPVLPTFHPSYLLRNAEAKKPCWEDLQAVLKMLGRTPPKK